MADEYKLIKCRISWKFKESDTVVYSHTKNLINGLDANFFPRHQGQILCIRVRSQRGKLIKIITINMDQIEYYVLEFVPPGDERRTISLKDFG